MAHHAKTPATVIERPGEASFREVTLTPKREDTVVCRTLMSAISTGTDMKTYHGMQHPEQCYYPLVPGYENMGVVVEEGSYAPGFKKGDRVMINECRKYLDCCAAWGGGTLLVHKDSDNAGGAGDPLCRIPDNVTDEQAAALEEEIRNKYGAKTEITFIKGGQPVYYYIISVE